MFSTLRFACLTVLKTRLVSSITGQSQFFNGELNKQQRQRQRKRHLRVNSHGFKFHYSNLFHSIQFVKCLGCSLELILTSEKEKENCCLDFTSAAVEVTLGSFRSSCNKGENKRDTRAKLLFYQSDLLLFCRSRCRRRRCCLSSLIPLKRTTCTLRSNSVSYSFHLLIYFRLFLLLFSFTYNWNLPSCKELRLEKEKCGSCNSKCKEKGF